MNKEGYKNFINDYCRNVATNEHEQTNEEWFDSLSTEEKAEQLFSWYKLGIIHKANEIMPVDKKWIMEWLKKKHEH